MTKYRIRPHPHSDKFWTIEQSVYSLSDVWEYVRARRAYSTHFGIVEFSTPREAEKYIDSLIAEEEKEKLRGKAIAKHNQQPSRIYP